MGKKLLSTVCKDLDKWINVEDLTISARCVGKNLWIATEGINLCLSISIRCCYV